MIRLFWRLFGRRLRWVVLGTLGRWFVRTLTDREVNKTADELDEIIPSSVKAVAERLPGDPVRVGAQAVVAGRSLRRAAEGSAQATRVANDGRRRVARLTGRVVEPVAHGTRSAISAPGRITGELTGEWRRETDLAERELRSQRARNTEGAAVADDLLMDVRPPQGKDSAAVVAPLEDVPPPVTQGRLRREQPVRRLVQRVQRTYLPSRPSWDR